MATGDAATAAGMALVAPTDDRRNGYNEINKTRDYLATIGLAGERITAGTIATARIPNLDASKITAGTIATARIPNLDASKITAGTIATARLPADDAATAGTIALRTTSGRLAVGTPTSSGHAVTKAYCDANVPTSSLANGPTDTAYARSATGSSWYATWMNSSNQFMRNTSSRRYKKRIRTLTDALTKIMDLRPVTYEATDPTVQGRHIGLIAEEVADIFPEVVPLENGKPEAVNYEFLVAPLIGAVQELAARIAALENPPTTEKE